ncbi:hypothetical protein B296_00039025 [Ensete ventricosum]|uniref:Uncharacterized protein n=1 Tax=Ensete ventricosum TaxID=4639 RepID=A0A426ZUQ4_ENSVE|nr:hypothetical protein B296_00039025 [Ensete ventricosum]
MENLKIEKHEWAAGQGFYCEQSTFPKDLGAISRHCLFQSDANMPSFSSMENVGGAKGCCSTLSECDGQINEHSVSSSSKRKVHGGSNPLHDKSQVVSSSFEQLAACTDGGIIPNDDGVGASQACTKSSFRLDCKQIYNLQEQRDGEIPIGDLQQSTSSSSITPINHSSSPFQHVIDKDTTQMPKKKRRRVISDLSPWYKEVTGAARQHNSMR